MASPEKTFLSSRCLLYNSKERNRIHSVLTANLVIDQTQTWKYKNRFVISNCLPKAVKVKSYVKKSRRSIKNLPQLVLSLGVIAGAAGSAAPSSLNASNSMSILNGATQSKKIKKRYWKKSLKSSDRYSLSANVQTDLYSPQIGTFVFTIFAGSMLNIHPQKASWVGVGFVPWQHAVDAPTKNHELKILKIDLNRFIFNILNLKNHHWNQ